MDIRHSEQARSLRTATGVRALSGREAARLHDYHYIAPNEPASRNARCSCSPDTSSGPDAGAAGLTRVAISSPQQESPRAGPPAWLPPTQAAAMQFRLREGGLPRRGTNRSPHPAAPGHSPAAISAAAPALPDSMSTSSTLISAGFTPLTRLACPRVAGRSAANLSAHSRRNPRTCL